MVWINKYLNEKSSKILHHQFSTSQVASIIATAQGKIIICNKKADEMMMEFGSQKPPFTNQNIGEVLGVLSEKMLDFLDRACKGEVVSEEFVVNPGLDSDIINNKGFICAFQRINWVEGNAILLNITDISGYVIRLGLLLQNYRELESPLQQHNEDLEHMFLEDRMVSRENVGNIRRCSQHISYAITLERYLLNAKEDNLVIFDIVYNIIHTIDTCFVSSSIRQIGIHINNTCGDTLFVFGDKTKHNQLLAILIDFACLMAENASTVKLFTNLQDHTAEAKISYKLCFESNSLTLDDLQAIFKGKNMTLGTYSINRVQRIINKHGLALGVSGILLNDLSGEIEELSIKKSTVTIKMVLKFLYANANIQEPCKVLAEEYCNQDYKLITWTPNPLKSLDTLSTNSELSNQEAIALVRARKEKRLTLATTITRKSYNYPIHRKFPDQQSFKFSENEQEIDICSPVETESVTSAMGDFHYDARVMEEGVDVNSSFSVYDLDDKYSRRFSSYIPPMLLPDPFQNQGLQVPGTEQSRRKQRSFSRANPNTETPDYSAINRRTIRMYKPSDDILQLSHFSLVYQPGNPTILIVDDTRNQAIALQSLILREMQAEFEFAQTADEAVAKFKSYSELHFMYYMILIDVIMPKKDGFQAVQGIRNMEVIMKYPRSFICCYSVKASHEQQGEDIDYFSKLQVVLKPLSESKVQDLIKVRSRYFKEQDLIYIFQ